jgi:hypothetical protein
MKIARLLMPLATVVAALACNSPAYAQATRTWVSGVGDDANPCSRTAPCKTFAGAISKTAAGGEISVLDPGGFGTVTITKAITLNGAGTLAGILSAAGVNGIVVNAGVNDVVIVRNISINGAGTGLNGIRFLAGGHLYVENCTISGVTTHGIDVAHSGVGAGTLTVANTTLANIGDTAIRVDAAAGTPATQASHITISGAATGFHVLAGTATIADSFISQVTNQGVAAENSGTKVNVKSCAVDASGTGVAAVNAGAKVRISDCDIFQNGTGVSVAAGGNGESFGNNRIRGNVKNIVGNLPKVSQR